MLLAVENGKVIGQLGLIPVKLKFKEKIYDAQWACDLLVDPDQRKHGIGSKLFEAGMNRDVISLGNNASPRADRLMLNLGFKAIPSGRSMVFPLDPKHLLKWVVPSRIDFTIPVLSKLIQPYYSVKKNRLRKNETDFKICEWEKAFEQVMQKQNEMNTPHVYHDKDFMNWRANGFENFSLKIDAAKNKNGSYALHSVFLPYYNIYEWFCKSINDLKSLLALMINVAIEKKSLTLQLIANTNEEEKWLRSLGFVRSRSSERIIHYSKDKVLDASSRFYFTLYDTDLNL